MRMTSFLTTVGLLALAVVPQARAGAVTQKTLGPVVAVERQFSLDYETCAEELGVTGPYSYGCAVALSDRRESEQLVSGGNLDHRARRCDVRIAARAYGYRVHIEGRPGPYPREISRSDALGCLREAFEELNLRQIRLRAVVYTVEAE